jgi:hypothetical protein
LMGVGVQMLKRKKLEKGRAKRRQNLLFWG